LKLPRRPTHQLVAASPRPPEMSFYYPGPLFYPIYYTISIIDWVKGCTCYSTLADSTSWHSQLPSSRSKSVTNVNSQGNDTRLPPASDITLPIPVMPDGLNITVFQKPMLYAKYINQVTFTRSPSIPNNSTSQHLRPVRDSRKCSQNVSSAAFSFSVAFDLWGIQAIVNDNG
jgi:hypothetical protein